MFSYRDIPADLERAALDKLQFELYRLVDPTDHRVYECIVDTDGALGLRSVPGTCFDIWKRPAPCLNCTSRSCLAQDAAVFKIEYLDGQVLLIASIPVEVGGRRLSLELAKDVTSSLVVADVEERDNVEITYMINKFNDLAVRDAFTGLFNKTYIHNELEGLVAEAGRDAAHGPAVLIELDVDAFKQVNDTYGHGAGDDALLFFARRLRGLAEELNGWAGRFGGDEFMFCVPGGLTDDEIERFFAEIDTLEAHLFDATGRTFSVAASCGACRVREDDTVRSLLDRVDAAMYQAKQTPTRRVIAR